MSEPGHPLRHAIVGVGATVLGMHRAALDLPTVQLVGVTDVNAEAAEARAEELGCPAFADYQSLIREARPDVVVVMTPHPGRVKIEVPIALPRPRDPLSVEFLDYQKQLLRHLGQEAH